MSMGLRWSFVIKMTAKFASLAPGPHNTAENKVASGHKTNMAAPRSLKVIRFRVLNVGEKDHV